MDPVEIGAILSIIELILKYGLPAALEMIKELQTSNPTAADIQALTLRVPPPDSYEKGGA